MLSVFIFLLFLPWTFADFAITPVGDFRKGILKDNIDSPGRKLLSVPGNLGYAVHSLPVPVDHFLNSTKYAPHSTATFPLRYFLDDSYYQEGGPVFLLESGETDATARLPFLKRGLIHELIKVTHGIGVVLEHRYYGQSFPVTDLSAENMRFLTTEQSIADAAYFAENVVFPGHENATLNPPNTPWIAYGGSYAGAFVAFCRKIYPRVFWGMF